MKMSSSGKALVSVCIPSYNASRYIGETIRSVLDSTYSNLEIIINDDVSTDKTREIVESFSNRRVCFFQNESNLGVPKNWNRVLEKASGEFVGLLNHDDLYGPFWLTFAVHVLEKHPHVGWVATAFRIIDDKDQTLDVVSRLAETGEYSRNEAFLCVAKLDGLGPGYIARREILEEVGYYDEVAGPSADNDLFLRLASRYPLYYSNYPHAAWRLHADNLTHRWGPIEQTTEGLRMLNKIFSNDALPEELRKHKKSCYIYYYHKVLVGIRELLKKGDLETVQHLIRLLYTNGYRDSEINTG
ncbi:MAG: glycosyltransferase [Deltaproteobacteria bacterium]|nr:glycosyltransferase [Deltaproteobacteria bacterium]